MSQNSWFEHFKEQLQGLTEAFESSGTHLSLLGYALKEQRLSSEEYFKWAVAQYQLPKLQSRFFTETPPSLEMFAKWATHYRWSEECLPVAEWDGSLIVVCLQPPQDFPHFPTAVLVLSEPENIQKAWDHFHPKQEVVAAAFNDEVTDPLIAQPVVEAPKLTKIDSSAPKEARAVNQKTGVFSIEDLGMDLPAENEAQENTKSGAEDADQAEPVVEGLADNSGDTIVGLFDGPAVAKLDSLGEGLIKVKTETVSVISPILELPTISTKPEKKSSILEKIIPVVAGGKESTETSAAPAETAASSSRISADATSSGFTGLSKIVPPTPPPKSAPPIAETSPSPFAPSAKTPPPPAPTVAEQVAEDSFANAPVPVPIVARPAGIAKPTVNPVASGNFALDKIKKKNATLINDRIKEVLSEMKAHFNKSMILTLDDQETQIAAFAWDENFKDLKDTSMRVPLKTPSIFNIVVATQKPYHGYISLNEINEKFFDGWNQGRVPDHVTISPLVMSDKLVGLLVGFADKTAYNKASLNLAEKLSANFFKGFQAA